MINKISREDCLKQYPVFPLRFYDELTDDETYFYPEVISRPWMHLGIENKEERTEAISQVLTALFRSLNVESLIFLGDTEQTWISKLALKRKDHQPLINAVAYFIANGADQKFNGGLQVSIDQIQEFLIHFCILTSCDGSLPYFNFIDKSVQVLGLIHYSGDMRIEAFNGQANNLLGEKLQLFDFKFKPR
jgi:hypothetical protein